MLMCEWGGARSSMSCFFWENEAPPSNACSVDGENNAAPPPLESESDLVSDVDWEVIVFNALETLSTLFSEAFFKASNIRTKLTASSKSVSGPEMVKTFVWPLSCRVEETEKVVATELLEGMRTPAPLLLVATVLFRAAVSDVVGILPGGVYVVNGSLPRVPFYEMTYSQIWSSFRLSWQKAVSAGVEVKVTRGQRCFGIKNSSPWTIGTEEASVPVHVSFDCSKMDWHKKNIKGCLENILVQLYRRTMQG